MKNTEMTDCWFAASFFNLTLGQILSKEKATGPGLDAGKRQVSVGVVTLKSLTELTEYFCAGAHEPSGHQQNDPAGLSQIKSNIQGSSWWNERTEAPDLLVHLISEGKQRRGHCLTQRPL